MTRFFIRPDQIIGETITLDPEDALHLDRVIRAKIGTEIGVLDGTGELMVANLTILTKSRAEARIVRREPLDTEPSVSITLAQALPKTAEKLEWILQHGVEVGADAFWIFRSRHSEAGKLAEKLERWEKIIKTAAEQSGRSRLPDVRVFPSTASVAEHAKDFDLAIACDEAQIDRPTSLREPVTDKTPKSILTLIGPEGGWADEERNAFASYGITRVSLGRRILRTETAALVAISQILFALNAD